MKESKRLDKAVEYLEVVQQIIVVQAQIDKSKTARFMDVGNRLRICKEDLRELARGREDK